MFALLGLPGYTGNNPLGNAGVDNRTGYLIDEQAGHRVDAEGEHLNIDYSIDPGTFTWVQGYRSQDSSLPSDYTGVVGPISVFDANRSDRRKTWQEELRFASKQIGNFNFVAGAFYQHDNTKFCVAQVLGIYDLFGVPTPPGLQPGGYNNNPQALCNAQTEKTRHSTAQRDDRGDGSAGFQNTIPRRAVAKGRQRAGVQTATVSPGRMAAYRGASRSSSTPASTPATTRPKKCSRVAMPSNSGSLTQNGAVAPVPAGATRVTSTTAPMPTEAHRRAVNRAGTAANSRTPDETRLALTAGLLAVTSALLRFTGKRCSRVTPRRSRGHRTSPVSAGPWARTPAANLAPEYAAPSTHFAGTLGVTGAAAGGAAGAGGTGGARERSNSARVTPSGCPSRIACTAPSTTNRISSSSTVSGAG